MKDIRSTEPGLGVLATLLQASGRIRFRHDTIYNQFFAHSKNCNHSDMDSAENTIQLIAISDLVKKAQSLAVDLLESDNWACSILLNITTCYSLVQLCSLTKIGTVPATEFNGHLVARCVLLDRKGVVSLHLLQREDAIPMVIEGDTRLVTEYLDAVLLIRNFDVVVENIRPPDAKQNGTSIAWLLVHTHHIAVIHRTSKTEQPDLVPAILDSCTWPTRQDGQLRSQCTITTSHDTCTVQALTGVSAALARYMSTGMTLKVHLSRADTFDCGKAN